MKTIVKNSSTVEWFEIDDLKQSVTVKFKKGLYRYDDVPVDVRAMLIQEAKLEHGSVGTLIANKLRGHYVTTKLD